MPTSIEADLPDGATRHASAAILCATKAADGGPEPDLGRAKLDSGDHHGGAGEPRDFDG